MFMASRNGFTEGDVPDQSSKCFVVTGANTGIGFEISRVLAERGARVIMACRTKDKADTAIATLKKRVPKANLAYLPFDQADLDSIHSAVDILSGEPRIDVLINNAGVMPSRLKRTKQNFELQFAVNHLGCFAFTVLLMPKLSEIDGARVVVTSSNTHRKAKIDWEDLNAEKSYVASKRYAASKLANALFFFELDRRLRNTQSKVMAVGCHPGAATTEIARDNRLVQVFMPVLRLFLNTPFNGCLAGPSGIDR